MRARSAVAVVPGGSKAPPVSWGGRRPGRCGWSGFAVDGGEFGGNVLVGGHGERPVRFQRGGGGAGVPQLDQQADEGVAGQDSLDAPVLHVLDRGRREQVAVVDGQGGEPLPGVAVRDQINGSPPAGVLSSSSSNTAASGSGAGCRRPAAPSAARRHRLWSAGYGGSEAACM